MPVAGLLGQPGHRFLEFVVFAVAVVLIILGPTVIDLLKGNSTSGLSRSTIAYAVLGIVALSLALSPLPQRCRDRPRLDQFLSEAGLGLVYDDAEHGYRWPTRAADTKGLASRQGTIHGVCWGLVSA